MDLCCICYKKSPAEELKHIVKFPCCQECYTPNKEVIEKMHSDNRTWYITYMIYRIQYDGDSHHIIGCKQGLLWGIEPYDYIMALNSCQNFLSFTKLLTDAEVEEYKVKHSHYSTCYINSEMLRGHIKVKEY